MEGHAVAGRIQSITAVSVLLDFQQAITALGPIGTIGLIARKIVRQIRYRLMLRALPRSKDIAKLNELEASAGPRMFEASASREAVVERAEAILRDENVFFTFLYVTRGLDRPWEFDPIERKYWSRRHYTERKLHAADTPRDVKIVWEINRFKDLPILGQAASLTRDKNYAAEVERRLLSWIQENPFAATINWASALEISIRLISWTVALTLLREAGLEIDSNPAIARSIFEQASYLAADLSTDKVVPTNHLVGEAAGLYIISSLWKFRGNRRYARVARRILKREIARQTFPDGVTREASSWYHQFVTHFFDLVDRVAARTGDTLGEEFTVRLSKMKAYLEMLTVHGEVVRYGDADDGWALWMEGDMEAWKGLIFGPVATVAAKPSQYHHPYAKIEAAHLRDAFLFLRAGQFGMGGAGFASHAHDDFLSPIIYLEGVPVLVDPGTFVYNGNPIDRAKYRSAEAHNGIVIGGSTGAVQKLNFGWQRTRPDAKILEAAFTVREAIVTAQYGEWPKHKRIVKVNQSIALIVDRFSDRDRRGCEWHLHLAPEWMLEGESSSLYRFVTNAGDRLSVKLRGNFETVEAERYDFSPSYGVARPGTMLRLSTSNPSGVYAVLMSIDRAKNEVIRTPR